MFVDLVLSCLCYIVLGCAQAGSPKVDLLPTVNTSDRMVYVVTETAPVTLDVQNSISDILSVSAGWATNILARNSIYTENWMSVYGRKVSFRKDREGREVVDVEYFNIEMYPDWKSPRPWIVGGFPFYFRVTLDAANKSVLKGYLNTM